MAGGFNSQLPHPINRVRSTSNSPPADVRDTHDPATVRRIFNRPNQGIDHLIDRDQSQSPGSLPKLGDPFRNPIKSEKRNWPATPGSKHIPRPNECRVHSALPNQLFTPCPDLLKSFHDRRRLSDTQINEMLNAIARSRGYGRPDGLEIDGAELSRLGRTWMGHADQMHKRVGWGDGRSKRVCFQSVTNQTFSAGREFVRRTGPDQCPDLMPMTNEWRNQSAANVTGAAGNEHIHAGLTFYLA
jgi:hypothetical protein